MEPAVRWEVSELLQMSVLDGQDCVGRRGHGWVILAVSVS